MGQMAEGHRDRHHGRAGIPGLDGGAGATARLLRRAARPEPESLAETLSPQSVGEGCGAWCGFGIGPERPLDQRVDDGRSLCFDSEPLPARLEIMGAPQVTLELTVDRPAGTHPESG